MPNWRTFEPTVSKESWQRIENYVWDARDFTVLSDYPSVSSWFEMTSVLSMYENGLAVDSKYNGLIDDYKMYLEATS